MTPRESFSSFLTDLNRLNPDDLTIVLYDPLKHVLEYTQLNLVVSVPQISRYFLPLSGFRMGILNPHGLYKLKRGITELLSDKGLDEFHYIPNLGKLKTEWYKVVGITLPVPQKVLSMEYVSITNPFLVYLTCRLFNKKAFTQYKIAKKSLQLKISKN